MQKSLEKISGLPISLQGNASLKFDKPLRDVVPISRSFAEVLPVLMDPEVDIDSSETYQIYQNIYLPEHQDLIVKQKVRYDLTLLPPLRLGQEFNKTIGHFHAVKKNSNITYPKVFEILMGDALILIQKMDERFETVRSIYAIRGQAGDKIIYPPNYGHTLINLGKEPLVISSWVSVLNQSRYEEVVKHRGFAYYVVYDHEQGFKFVPNKNYDNLPAFRILDTKFMTGFAISSKKPMYTTGVENPESLDFLNNPERYATELSGITS